MIEDLLRNPHRYDFFQAVRVLEEAFGPGSRVGRDHPPQQEAVRFRALPALSFSGSDVTSLRKVDSKAAKQQKDPAGPQWEMDISFMGLTGPQGVLPQHYTRLLLERLRQRDPHLREFFDLFEHRMVSLYYRAWEKHFLPAQFDQPSEATGIRLPGDSDRAPQAQLQLVGDEPLFTRSLYSLVGRGHDGMRGRLDIPDEVFLYYAGHFSDERRPVDCLERMLTDYFGLAMQVEQFVGQWLQLERHQQSRLPARRDSQNAHNVLGDGLVIGERVWDVQSKFRVRVGPLDLPKFTEFLPNGKALQPLMDFIRAYAGSEFDFDVQLLLRGEQVPHCRLGVPGGSSLGWNTWIATQPPDHDVADAVFAASPSSLAH